MTMNGCLGMVLVFLKDPRSRWSTTLHPIYQRGGLSSWAAASFLFRGRAHPSLYRAMEDTREPFDKLMAGLRPSILRKRVQKSLLQCISGRPGFIGGRIDHHSSSKSVVSGHRATAQPDDRDDQQVGQSDQSGQAIDHLGANQGIEQVEVGA